MKSLRLHKRLYSAAGIRAAAEAFAELAQIGIQTDDPHASIQFQDIDPDVEDVIVAEFANFALAETIEGRTKAP